MSRYIQNADIAWRLVDGEAVLVSPTESRVIVLNDTAGCLWAFLEESRTEAECVRELDAHFDVDNATASRDVHEFIEQFLDKGLILASDG